MSVEKGRPQLILAASGEGTTVEAILDIRKELPVDIVAVFSNRKDAEVLKKARRKGFPKSRIRVIPKGQSQEEEICQFMDETGANAIAMLGYDSFMKDGPINKSLFVINQHPAGMDPGRVDKVTQEQLDYGGLGMLGAAPITATIAYNWATGNVYQSIEATVHFVNPGEGFDQGKLLQMTPLDISWATPSVTGWRETIPVGEIFHNYRAALKAATMDVREALRPVEHTNVIEALKQFESGIPRGFNREQPLIDPGQGREYILFMAKDIGRKIAPRGKLI